MKKTLTLLIIGIGLLGSFSLASEECLELSFNDGDVCVYIEKNGDNYELSPEVSNTDGTVALRCDILLPDNTLQYVGACDGDFDYDQEEERKIKLYVRLNNEYKQKEGYYNFEEGERGYSDQNDDDNDYYGELDSFSLSTDDSSPSINQRVDLSIEAIDSDDETVEDYNGTVNFKVYYCSSSTCSLSSTSNRTQTTSSTYFEIDSDYQDGYEFDSSDDGEVDLSNFIKFKRDDYAYKVRVYDEDDTSTYKEIKFSVGSSSSDNGELDSFSLSTDGSSPSINQRVDLSIEAIDSDDETVEDYNGTVNFKVYYCSSSTCSLSSTSNRTQTTSSTYFEIDSDYQDGYEFDSSDDGEVDLSNFIKFKRDDYAYKVRVYDEDDTSIYKEIKFSVGSDSDDDSELDNFYLTTDDLSPATSQRIDLKIKARDNYNSTIDSYRGTVKFRIYYRSSSSSYRKETTSSSYYSINSDYEDGYSFTYSDKGYATLSNFIEFCEDYNYKIKVYDEDDTSIYKEIYFSVGTFSDDNNDDDNYGELDSFSLSTDDSSPSINQRVDLSIEAIDSDDETVEDYNGTVNFKVYYCSSSTCSLSSTSNRTQTTSSTYFEIDSDYEDGYEFNSSDNGEVDLSNFINFKRDDYAYKVRVYDEDDTSIYKEIKFSVGSYSDDYEGNFSSSELDKVEALYDARDGLIDNLETSYYKLKNSTTRQEMSDDLYQEMGNILDGEESIYADRDEFYDGFLSRYSYTLRTR